MPSLREVSLKKISVSYLALLLVGGWHTFTVAENYRKLSRSPTERRLHTFTVAEITTSYLILINNIPCFLILYCWRDARPNVRADLDAHVRLAISGQLDPLHQAGRLEGEAQLQGPLPVLPAQPTRTSTNIQQC